MKWIEDVCTIIDQVRLSTSNQEFESIIKKPWGFYRSTPGKYNEASDSNIGETNWQRRLYEAEDMWYDLELPIGQYKKNDHARAQTKRTDLIGEIESRFVLCELKYTKSAGNPFDAILQLLAYYQMIVHNAQKLDEQNIHHTNARNKYFKWEAINNNPILMLRANDAYWGNWSKDTQKNRAAKAIIEKCKEHRVEIQLWNEDGQL